MNIRKIMIGLALSLILTGAVGAALARPPEGMPLPPHGMFHMMGVSGICGDQQHLYVMAGGKILQYGLADLKLLKTVDLPKPAPPKGMEEGKLPPPPPMGGPHGIWAGGGSLFVLAGPMIYRFSTPDLKLLTSVELPKPEHPKAGK
jgi:hypothetical protein